MSQDDIFMLLLRIFFAVGIVTVVAMLFMLGKAFYSYLKIYNSYQGQSSFVEIPCHFDYSEDDLAYGIFEKAKLKLKHWPDGTFIKVDSIKKGKIYGEAFKNNEASGMRVEFPFGEQPRWFLIKDSNTIEVGDFKFDLV